MRLSLALVAAFAVAGCSEATAPDPGLEGLSLTQVAPTTIVPGTKLLVKGASFVDDEWGEAVLHLTGSAGGHSIDVSWPAKFVDFGTMTVDVDGSMLDTVGGDVDFSGTAVVEIVATTDGATYKSGTLNQVNLSFRDQLTPTVDSVASGGIIFVNEKVEVFGSNFLLGGDEGQTVARVAGCFRLESGGGCTPIASKDVPLTPTDPLKRTEGTFAFSPGIAGIKPGSFEGTVTIINEQTNKQPTPADASNVTYDMEAPAIFTVCVGDPCSDQNITASLGQYVFLKGGGFVGGDANQHTELELAGNFTKNGSPAAQVTLSLIPDFVDGQLTRYIMNKSDELGTSLNLYMDTGTFTGTITPVIYYGADRVPGSPKNLTFTIGHVRQVIWLDFTAAYVEGLRDFGLRAVDDKIRTRILEVCNQAYKGVNMDFRTEEPKDFALFEHVELVGVDPNNMGLFGYDNSEGKDSGNERLEDRIGGVNAQTQEGGYPGYGGVFLRSLMGFSKHPNGLAVAVPGADVEFDQVFDPFRPDTGGKPILSTDLGSDIEKLTSGADCPGGDRAHKISCAVWVMGNLVGGTLSHEIGHSLGLANPFGDGFHDNGDGVNRLMDNGGDRSFFERAELEGQGPGVFCDTEYSYLRDTLPTNDPPNDIERPTCDDQ
ncbi:MAG TPA: hypothetical protein VGM39_13540 [Kofleriaceae bacterium]|jgi:hypothetical protein